MTTIGYFVLALLQVSQYFTWQYPTSFCGYLLTRTRSVLKEVQCFMNKCINKISRWVAQWRRAAASQQEGCQVSSQLFHKVRDVCTCQHIDLIKPHRQVKMTEYDSQNLQYREIMNFKGLGIKCGVAFFISTISFLAQSL